MQAEQANASTGISAFWLKIIAITGMLLQHTALALPGAFPLGFEIFLQISGGLTFPIIAFLLVEGFYATSNINKYMTRLAIFGGISFIPHLFVFSHGLNIMFTLLVGLVLLTMRQRFGSSPKFWFAFAGLTLASVILDWGIIGPVAIVLYDLIKNEKLRRILVPIFCAVGILALSALMAAVAAIVPIDNLGFQLPETTIAGAFFPMGCLLVIPLLLMYKGARGRPVRWFFYIFYPVHLAVLAIISIVMGKNILISVIRTILYELGLFF